MGEKWIGEFEEFPVFGLLDSPNQFDADAAVRIPSDGLTTEEIEDYKRVSTAHKAWQDRLKELYHQYHTCPHGSFSAHDDCPGPLSKQSSEEAGMGESC